MRKFSFATAFALLAATSSFAEERSVRGEHNGLREYSLPVRVSRRRRSEIVSVGEQAALGRGSDAVHVLVRASSHQETYGKDAARARARMEGSRYYVDIVIYR